MTDIPFQTSIEVIEQKIGELANAGDLDGICDVQNDSAGKMPRLVVTLKRDANANVVLNNLYKHTPLQTSFGVNMVALVDGVPRTLNLAQAISHYVDHQIEVITRRSEFRLTKARNRAHIVEGLLQGDRHARRGHRDDPGVGRPPRGAHRPHGRAVLLHARSRRRTSST